MKIAICSNGQTQEAKVSTRFARCEYFMIYDQDTMESTFVENTAKDEVSGAGGKVSKILSKLGVEIALVPQLGPKAFDALKAFGITSYEYKKDSTVHNALYDYFAKEYIVVDKPTGTGKH